jgi:hypothetical protein
MPPPESGGGRLTEGRHREYGTKDPETSHSELTDSNNWQGAVPQPDPFCAFVMDRIRVVLDS